MQNITILLDIWSSWSSVKKLRSDASKLKPLFFSIIVMCVFLLSGLFVTMYVSFLVIPRCRITSRTVLEFNVAVRFISIVSSLKNVLFKSFAFLSGLVFENKLFKKSSIDLKSHLESWKNIWHTNPDLSSTFKWNFVRYIEISTKFSFRLVYCRNW